MSLQCHCNRFTPAFIATAIHCNACCTPTAMWGVSLRDTPQVAVTAVRFQEGLV
jgi:hypothetical protein